MDQKKLMEYWRPTLEALAAVPVDAQLAPSDDKGLLYEEFKTFQNHAVRLTSLDGIKIRAWYTHPLGEPPSGGWPAIVTLPGYNGIQALPAHFMRHGYATLALYPRGQGESAKEWKIEHSTFVTYNITDKNRYFYRGAYADCVRGVDFLCARPEINPERIGVWGRSQGGGLTLALSSLDRRIKAAAAETPWPGNFPVSAERDTAAYREVGAYLQANPSQRAAMFETLAYFDPLNLVSNITAPTLVSAVMDDPVHFYETIQPVFEAIPGMKSFIVYPTLKTATGADFARHALDWFDRYLR